MGLDWIVIFVGVVCTIAGYIIGYNRGLDAFEITVEYEPDPDPIQAEEIENVEETVRVLRAA